MVTLCVYIYLLVFFLEVSIYLLAGVLLRGVYISTCWCSFENLYCFIFYYCRVIFGNLEDFTTTSE